MARPEEAYEALKHIQVRTIDEETLLTTLENHLEYLVEGEPSTVRSALADFALSKVHEVITVHDIWGGYLEEKGYHRRHWDKDPHVLVAVQEATERYLRSFREATINWQMIPRDEAHTIMQTFDLPSDRRCLLVTEEAGGGKSSVTLQVLKACREHL